MRDDRERLLEIKEAIERIEKYAQQGQEAFLADELIQTVYIDFWGLYATDAEGKRFIPDPVKDFEFIKARLRTATGNKGAYGWYKKEFEKLVQEGRTQGWDKVRNWMHSMYNEIFGADVEQDDLGWTVMADGKPTSVVRAQGSLFNSPANYTDPMGTFSLKTALGAWYESLYLTPGWGQMMMAYDLYSAQMAVYNEKDPGVRQQMATQLVENFTGSLKSSAKSLVPVYGAVHLTKEGNEAINTATEYEAYDQDFEAGRAYMQGLLDYLGAGLNLYGSFKLTQFGVSKLQSKPTVYIDPNRYPESARNISDAQSQGRPTVVTIDRVATYSNRYQAQKQYTGPKIPGYDIDEYPPASTREGGKGSFVRPIPLRDNRGSGASYGRQIRSFPNGTKIRIVPAPRSAHPPPGVPIIPPFVPIPSHDGVQR